MDEIKECVIEMDKFIIDNFKSVKHLELDSKRVNILIGKPNTGKSNILEALGLISHAYYGHYGYTLKNFIRIEDMTDIFYDREISEKVSVVFGRTKLDIIEAKGYFKESYKDIKDTSARDNDLWRFEYSGDGSVITESLMEELSAFKFYRFQIFSKFTEKKFRFLKPPYGDNLVYILYTNKELRALTSALFDEFGLKLVIKPIEDILEVQKQSEGVAIAYPFRTISDTLQRLVFHISAIKTTESSVIVLEEPESHAFPYYTKYLAELIASDEKNQYFISTHNPAFLLTMIQKAPKDSSMAFLTYFEDYQTKVKPIEHKKILDMEYDVFSDIDALLEV